MRVGRKQESSEGCTRAVQGLDAVEPAKESAEKLPVR